MAIGLVRDAVEGRIKGAREAIKVCLFRLEIIVGRAIVRETEGPEGRPVAVGLDSIGLVEFGEHDDDPRLLFPDHPPKVCRRVGQRRLRCDEQRLC